MTIDTVLARVTTSPSAAPVETVTPIKPSEAIRLGCLIAPVKGTGELVGRNGEACGVGAMLIGWNGPLENNDAAIAAMFSTDEFDEVEERTARCPAPHPKGHRAAVSCRRPPSSVYLVVQHLNDLSGGHEWSRERIADWLEGLGL